MVTFSPRELRKRIAVDGSLQRARHLGDRVVDFWAMGIDADLHIFHAQPAQFAASFSWIRMALVLSLTVKIVRARGLKISKSPCAAGLAAAERQQEDAGRGHLPEQAAYLIEGHLALVVVVQVAMDAALVASVGQVEMHAQRDAQRDRLGIHFLHQGTHGPPLRSARL